MKRFFIIAFILTQVVSLFSVVHLNDMNCLFSEGPDKIVIGKNMVTASTNFLESKAFADLFLMEYERSSNLPLDFAAALGYTEKAISSLEKARVLYVDARNIGIRIGYIEAKKSWFHVYNYDQLINQHKMNKEIAGKAKNFLVKADVLGVYQYNIDCIGKIMDTLQLISKKLKENQKPEYQDVWSLFQQYLEISLFGNYATIMGTTVLGVTINLDPCDWEIDG